MHLYLSESSAESGIHAISEAERAYWLSREKSFVTAPVEVDVIAFHEAAGLMYPLSWHCDTAQDTETFMLQEMICGNVTEIYVRIGRRYFRMQDYSNQNHADIVAKVRTAFSQNGESQK
ncbi:hypothetical protein SNN83_003834 [Cronobacter malonaticus]|jgi:hypothetical protein|nr:hypothetical protein [Cronobacter malonaticus]